MIRPAVLPLLAALLLAAPVSARAQGLDVDVDVDAGDGDVGVSVGSDAGVGADVELGSSGVTGTGNEQELALDAVRSARALPLDQILAAARRHTSGDIIDARLVELRGFLLYELKVIEAGGDVADLYFYARSGEIVRTE